MLVQGTVMSLHKLRNLTIKITMSPLHSAFAGQSSIEFNNHRSVPRKLCSYDEMPRWIYMMSSLLNQRESRDRLSNHLSRSQIFNQNLHSPGFGSLACDRQGGILTLVYHAQTQG